MEAGMLTCPGCGAPVDEAQVACRFCSAQLQTLACPSCLAMMFVGARHCAHCGARVFEPRPEAAAAGARACPRCHAPLTVSAVGDAFLEECGRCGGLWVDGESFRRVCERREQAAAFVGLGSPLPAPAPHDNHRRAPPSAQGRRDAARPDRVAYVACPECGKLMNRVNFARCSGVIVDVCKPHGIWFDKDELREILEFIRAGGLEAAHARELDARKHELERLRERVAPDEPHPYRGVLEAAGELLRWLVSE
jgi:Zn-finger nucleic acid-binding protein